jgi:hypothetical protein
MNKKDLAAKLASMDWSGMILPIKMIPSFTFLFPISILDIKKEKEFMSYIIDFMIYMKDEKITSFDFGPFRIHLNSIISNNSKYEHLNLKLKLLSFIENEFSLAFILDEYVKDKWNLNYTKKIINDYKVIQHYNNLKGYKDVVKNIETIITEIKEFNNLN